LEWGVLKIPMDTVWWYKITQGDGSMHIFYNKGSWCVEMVGTGIRGVGSFVTKQNREAGRADAKMVPS